MKTQFKGKVFTGKLANVLITKGFAKELKEDEENGNEIVNKQVTKKKPGPKKKVNG